MPVFVWNGTNKFGDSVNGQRVAANAEELTRLLQREQIKVESVSPVRRKLGLPFLKREKVKQKELAVFARQMAVLIDAELPLIQGLNIMAEQTRNAYFKRVISQVRADVEAGSSMDQALRKFPKVFDDLFCNLIASGEQSGTLDTMLQRLADYIERSVKLKGQVKQAMTYPVAILAFSVIVAIFMLWKVIPTFAQIFVDLGAKLPGLTAFVMSMSNFVQKYIVFLVLGIIGAIFLFRYYRKTQGGRWTTDALILRLPLFGPLMSKVAISRITRTLSTLLGGGVSMLESIKITSSTAGNVILEKSMMDVRKQVTEGRSLTDSIKSTGRFPFMMVQMVSVGEATGTLDKMLSKLADFYDGEVETTVGMLMSVLEPIMMVFVGGMVGGLIISMYLPIFSLMGQIQ
ncbi:MAG: type II secretion system F family protein [Candidatus Aminicenantes bacterium]|nr:type II secretion system F family protein [Candidatus Aminicenantes bacterium]